MNEKRRQRLRPIATKLREIIGTIQLFLDAEQDTFYGLPESIQESARGDDFTERIDHLADAIDLIDQAADHIDEAAS